jgi:type I restriction enzyme S subunit
MNQEIKQRIDIIHRGEVPKGYKKTSVGVLPNTWQVDRLSNYLIEYDEILQDDDNFPVATSSRQGLMLQSDYYQQKRYEETKVGYHVVPRGYVTYRHMSDDDIFRFNVNTLEDKVLVSPEYPVFCTTTSMSLSYLVNYLNTSALFHSYCRAQKKGSTRTRLYFKNLKQFIMPIPPMAEQEKIAEILTHCDEVIDLKKQLVDKKRLQKKWLMQNLLNPDSGIRLPRFNGEWKEQKMGKLFEFLSSASASRDQLGNKGYCYLHYGDIHKRSMTFVDVRKEYNNIPKINCNTIPTKSLLKNGDVVFVDASEDYAGASKYVVIENQDDIPFIAGLHTIVARSRNNELSIHYKKYCFQSYNVKKQIAFYVSGMKVYGLSKSSIAKLSIKYPPLDEQTAIANVLFTADQEIELLKQDFAKWEKNKKALMQLLLTGIVRTV